METCRTIREYVIPHLDDEQVERLKTTPIRAKRVRKLVRWVADKYEEKAEERRRRYSRTQLEDSGFIDCYDALVSRLDLRRAQSQGVYNSIDKRYFSLPTKYRRSKMMSLSDYRRKFSGSFYLYGGVGTGKTHTAYSIRKMSIYMHILKGRSQIDVINFPEYVMQYKIGTFDAKQRIISDLSEEDYMILDDLGAEYVSDASLEMLMVILNARYEAGLYTGFTSNFSIGKLPYDARIKSRIAEIVGKRKHEMKGKDRRIKSEE